MLLCQYRNPSEQPQVLRMISGARSVGERVVLPHQSITFHADPEAVLEIVSGQPITAMIDARIPCRALCIKVIKTEAQRTDLKSLTKPKRSSSLKVLDLSTDKVMPEDRGGWTPTFEKV